MSEQPQNDKDKLGLRRWDESTYTNSRSAEEQAAYDLAQNNKRDGYRQAVKKAQEKAGLPVRGVLVKPTSQ